MLLNESSNKGAVNLPLKHSLEAVQAACRARVEDLVFRSPEIKFASVSTVDGRVFALVSAKDDISGPRISALTSSMLALGESLARESKLGRSEYSALSAEGGSIVLVRIPAARSTYILSLGADHSQSMGMILRDALDTAQILAGIFEDFAGTQAA